MSEGGAGAGGRDPPKATFMSVVKNPTAHSLPVANEGFTQGGDLTLRSTDGVDFSVHSVLLSLASPAFSDLLKTGDREETIRFSENAEVLALMLRFIYPTPTPIISSIEVLNNALRVASKYQVDSMQVRLREQLVHVDSPVSVYRNPLGVLYVASAYGFTEEAELAASLVSKRCDFGTGEALKLLLGTSPIPASVALVKLTGIPLVKRSVLMDVLFHFECSPMTIYNGTSSLVDTLVCGSCQPLYKNVNRQSPPEWQMRWARWIFEEIKDQPIAQWKDYFSHSNFGQSFHQPGLQATSSVSKRYEASVKSCSCLSTVTNCAEQFQTWADGVFEHLKSRLVAIVELEDQTRDPGLEKRSQVASRRELW